MTTIKGMYDYHVDGYLILFYGDSSLAVMNEGTNETLVSTHRRALEPSDGNASKALKCLLNEGEVEWKKQMEVHHGFI